VLVGNVINHGLYHALIDVQSQPYLPDTWQSDELPPGVLVEDMMPNNKPIVIPESGGLSGINEAIGGNNYTDFPLVDDNGTVRGMVTRTHLQELVDRGEPVTAAQLEYVSDLHPITVRKYFPLRMAYELFKAMDMRSLVVVDDNHRPVAVTTRFAFLAWRVKERMGSERANQLNQREEERRTVQRERRRSSLSSSPLSSPRMSPSSSPGPTTVSMQLQ